MTFSFHPAAGEELREAAFWYEERSLLAGDRFVAEVKTLIDVIMTDPSRFRYEGSAIRVAGLKRFPYRLYFTADEKAEEIYIWAVMHEKRRPDYWRDRLTDGE